MIKALVMGALVLGVGLGCGGKTQKAESGPAAAPAAESQPEGKPTPTGEAPAEGPESMRVDKPAIALPGEAQDDPCVTRCVRQNSMRAVAPEQIEADCATACAKERDKRRDAAP